MRRFDHRATRIPSAPWVCAILLAFLGACGGGLELVMLPDHVFASPTPMQSSLRFVKLGMGGWHSCGLDANGEAWCWGANDRGQLGSTVAQTCSGGNIACTFSPQRMSGGHVFDTFDGSYLHSCGLDRAGKAWCWGFGIGGQLGDGSQTDSVLPLAVSGTRTYVALDVGINNLVTCALEATGAAWCWGPASSGALGDGSGNASVVPVQVTGGVSFVSISTGGEHACGLDTGGAAWCWGKSALGKGSSGPALVPTPVATTQRFSAISAGGLHTCALAIDATVWCWGAVAFGWGGTTPVQVAGDHRFASLTSGYQHICGLKGDGSAWCWGAGWGLLGDGTREAANAPVAVAGGLRFVDLAAGGTHSCGIATDGSTYCWGSNSFGQVGQEDVDP